MPSVPRFAARALGLGEDTAKVVAVRLSETGRSAPVSRPTVLRALRLVTAALDQQLFIDADGTFGELSQDALVDWLSDIFMCALRSGARAKRDGS